MQIGQLTLTFPEHVTAEMLEEKLSEVVAKYKLGAEYEERKVTITGPTPILEQISAAYQTQKMFHKMSGFNVKFNFNQG